MRPAYIKIPAALLLLAIIVAGCTQVTTAPTTTTSASTPRFDGGLTLGSGHREGTDTTSAASAQTVAQDSDGGLTLGSGH